MKLRLAFLIATAACSSDDGPNGVVTRAPAALDAYCTVQSQGELFAVRWTSSQSWSATDTPFPSGTAMFLASDDKGSLEGYAFMDDEPIRLIRADKELKLVAGANYSGSCPAPLRQTPYVVLRDATLFASEDLGGASCKLSVGTVVEDNSVGLRSGGVARVEAPAIQTACGFGAAYSKELAMGKFIKK